MQFLGGGGEKWGLVKKKAGSSGAKAAYQVYLVFCVPPKKILIKLPEWVNWCHSSN